jgi:hypothetical protein
VGEKRLLILETPARLMKGKKQRNPNILEQLNVED